MQAQCESNLFWTWEVRLKTNMLLFLRSLLTSLPLKARQIQWLVNVLLEKSSLNSYVLCTQYKMLCEYFMLRYWFQCISVYVSNELIFFTMLAF